ncbi:hypothetical protein KKG71_06945 [Patescibacteria group bacterium]|nr:hypothetical protein [Patescibacteria group bacterium]
MSVVKKVETKESIAEVESVTNLSDVEVIEREINKIGAFDVTIWTLDEKMAKSDSKPPFEILINVGNGQIDSCYKAKRTLFDVMKAVYTNKNLKGKIARVQFTAWGQLKGSIGAKDTQFDWGASGPSNFWTVLQKYRLYVDVSSPVDERTFGVRINKGCE